MDVFNGIQDMSINSGTSWQTVTLMVGSERRAFQVHVKRLGPLAAQLETLSEYIDKPDWDADVFNLIMNWTYRTPLPRIQNLAKWFCPDMPFPDLKLLNADQFAPHIERESATSGAYERIMNLSAQPQRRQFSIEELRLHFVQNATNPQTNRNEAIEQPTSQSENTPGPQTRSVDQEFVGYTSTSSRSTIPNCIPDKEAAKAEKVQTLLFKLMIFAEKYRWEPLFNDAIDAFYYGETQLRRIYVPAPYIDLAFSDSQSTTVLRFILRYAMALGYKHNSISKYQDLILSHHAILSYLLAAIDSRTLAGFRHGSSLTQNSISGPLESPNAVFHIHNGRAIPLLDCQMEGGCSTSSGPFGTPSRS